MLKRMSVKQRAYQVNLETLIEIMTKGWLASIECIEGIPKNAKYIRQYYHVQYDTVVLVFEHPSFDEVEIGAALEMFIVTHRKYELQPMPEVAQ